MTENKQFKIVNDCGDYHLLDGDEQLCYDLCSLAMRKANWNNVVDKLNEQGERISELESENKMLKVTIGRNESYIKRLTMKGKWSNTGDVE